MPAALSQIRLSVLLARASDRAVIFRRGPSKRVLLIRWHRMDDSFYFGQWFKGRIYEHRCDLSPDGERLLYFAASYKPPHFSWTAISRPPFLTALALWPKGDCWGGGGAFVTKHRVRLNHRDGEMKLAGSSRLPKAMVVEPFGKHSGWGEDSPIHEALLSRDGWQLTNEGKAVEHKFSAPLWYSFSPPQVWSKPNPVVPRLILHSSLLGIGMREGPWHVLSHGVTLGARTVVDIGKSDWADWDRNGDLLFGLNGRLLRRSLEGKALRAEICLLDMTKLRFRELAPTEEARSWHLPIDLIPNEKRPL
jgi:hypothetical protein